MSSSISQAVRELAEPKLAEFTAKLIPTVDPARILGVRMPALRKRAVRAAAKTRGLEAKRMEGTR